MQLTYNDTTHNSTTDDTACHLNVSSWILIILYFHVFVIGVLGNFLVLYIFLPKWKKGTIMDMLIIYLAIFDLLSSIINPILFVYWTATCFKRWDLGLAGCKILAPLGRIFPDITFGLIMIMALDRCRAILSTLKRRLQKYKLHIIVIILILFTVAFEGYYINALQLKDNECTSISIQEPNYHYPFIITTALRDMTYIIVFLVTSILIVFKIQSFRQNSVLLNRTSDFLQLQRRVIKMIIVMTVASAIAILPRDLLHLAYVTSNLHGTPGKVEFGPTLILINSFIKLLSISNSTYNVFIYGNMHSNFRRRVSQIYTRCSSKATGNEMTPKYTKNNLSSQKPLMDENCNNLRRSDARRYDSPRLSITV